MNGNTWIGYGRFTKDPELKTLDSGLATVSFTLACNKPKAKDKDHPEANFIDFVAWRETAEFICNFFKKGMRISISGHLNTRIHEKDGVKRKYTEVIVDKANFLDPKGTSDTTSNGGAGEPNDSYKEPTNTVDDDDDDELPF